MSINVVIDVTLQCLNLLIQPIQMDLYHFNQLQLPTRLMRFHPVALLLVHVFERL